MDQGKNENNVQQLFANQIKAKARQKVHNKFGENLKYL
jgi:hypothetical protein